MAAICVVTLKQPRQLEGVDRVGWRDGRPVPTHSAAGGRHRVASAAGAVLGSDIDLIGSPMPNRPLLIRRTGIRIQIVASHGRVIAVRVLRAIPSRVVARITETETITKVVAKKNAAEAEYGAAPESTKLPIEARIEVPICERMSSAEVAACERMPPAEVASPTMPAFVSACGYRRLRNPDGERGGE